MTINYINPNYNLLNTLRTVGSVQNSSVSSTLQNSVTGGTFSDVLGAVTSQENLQNSNSATNAVSDAESNTVNLDDIFQKASDTYGVPVNLLKAVAKAESNFNPNSESSCGAQGIMQLMPGTARSLGVTDSFDPEQNIMGGAKYLSQQLDRYDGNTVLALAAYNAGPGNVAKYNGVPPFEETQKYITKVLGYAGETMTAGEATLSAQTSALSSGNVFQDLSTGILNGSSDMTVKDYALLMDLYRYKMQLNILSDSDSNTESSGLLSNFLG